jgi:hypothetical protein
LSNKQLYEQEDYEREGLTTLYCYEEQNLYKSKLYILRDLGYEMVLAKELEPFFPVRLVEQMKQVVPGGVVAEYTPGSGGSSGVLRVAKPQWVSKGYSIGYAHEVYRSRDFEVYASCDIQWGTKRNLGNATYEITIADANIFWTPIIEKLSQPIKIGEPNNRNAPKHATNMRKRLSNRSDIDKTWGVAFKELVHNPAVSEGLVQHLAMFLSQFEDEQFIDILVQAMRSDDETVSQRAETILGKLQDHRAIYPLINLLRYRTSGPRAAILLKEITGQDFGQDFEQWRKWCFNQKQ